MAPSLRCLIGLAAAGVLLTACASKQANPSFAVTVRDAKADLGRMRDVPVRLERPVLVIGGFLDPGLVASSLSRAIRKNR